VSAFEYAWSVLKAYEVDGKLSMTPDPKKDSHTHYASTGNISHPTRTDAALTEINATRPYNSRYDYPPLFGNREHAKAGRTAPIDRDRNLVRIMADYLGVSEMDALDLMYPQFANPENKSLEGDDQHMFQRHELSYM